MLGLRIRGNSLELIVASQSVLPRIPALEQLLQFRVLDPSVRLDPRPHATGCLTALTEVYVPDNTNSETTGA